MRPATPGAPGAAPPIPHCARPCRTCPWRVDTVGRIAYSNLAEYANGTVGGPGAEAPLGSLLFACHAVDGWLCAGWLAVAGRDHLTVRFAVAVGALPAAVLIPGHGWPALFPTYTAMEAAHRGALTRMETP
ncbi:DUF6283 family protein [Actinomadura litoris]|uniref:DUF6283 family protein n=1 Tax=Actinomadura litoris TaxID=2678616 RepID=UPI001FA6FC84|nr:DUF6283 family protein [Actinomadura litoris]